MKALLWLVLVYSATSVIGGRRFIRTRPSRQSKEDKLSNKEILKELSRLLDDRGEVDVEIIKEDDEKEEPEMARKPKQFPGFVNPAGECELQGYETNIREECEEVSNIECKKVNVTMYRPEIRQRCKTSFDQICNVTYKDVPTDKCSPTKKNR